MKNLIAWLIATLLLPLTSPSKGQNVNKKQAKKEIYTQRYIWNTKR